jgi:hypothetical protein
MQPIYLPLVDVIYAECKSFNRFERKDAERMKELAATFPGSALVFATLNSELQESEVKLIQDSAIIERKKRMRGKSSSPVILLTGIELFAHRIADNWKKKGGIYERFGQRSFELTKLSTLADAAQQIYLHLPSWFDWSEVERKKGKNESRSRQEGRQGVKRTVTDTRRTTRSESPTS